MILFSMDGSLEVCIVSFPLVSGSLHPVPLTFLRVPESVQGHKYPCHSRNRINCRQMPVWSLLWSLSDSAPVSRFYPAFCNGYDETG